MTIAEAVRALTVGDCPTRREVVKTISEYCEAESKYHKAVDEYRETVKKYTLPISILDKIRAEIVEFEEDVFHGTKDYLDYAAVRHCLEIIDKYREPQGKIKEIERMKGR